MEQPQGAGELQQLRDDFAALQAREAALREKFEERVGNKHIQRVEVGESGHRLAVWVLIAASAMVLGMNIGQRDTITQQAAQINEMQRKYDRMQDYLNAIYAQAPQLKPKD